MTVHSRACLATVRQNEICTSAQINSTKQDGSRHSFRLVVGQCPGWISTRS